MLILVILFSIYFSGVLPNIYESYKTYIRRKEERFDLYIFYSQHFHYFQLLDLPEKDKFVKRTQIIRERKELRISDDIKTQNTDIENLVCAAFTQITFGYADFTLDRFTEIIIRPNYFYSKLVNNDVKGLTLSNGFIFYSWEDFLKGYMFEKDKVNLALHELAHALYIEKFHNSEEYDWNRWLMIAKKELELITESNTISFFRAYGKKNIHEFWAVCVECFFEDPINFRLNHSALYKATSIVLNQDMALRKQAIVVQ